MGSHVLITGGAGFIGSNLVDHFNLHAPEIKVTVFDDMSTGLVSNLSKSKCNLIQNTILDFPALIHATESVDSIIHLAALGSVPRSLETPHNTHEVNCTGTINVLEAARKNHVKHVVVASSSSVYGGNPSVPKTELDWIRPLSPYAVTKLATESYALAYSHSFNLETLALRFFNVYGPRQRSDHAYAAVIPRFVQAAVSGSPLTLFGDGEQSRDFTYVESVCATLFDAFMRRVSSNQPINLAFGNKISLLELIELIQKQSKKPISIKHEPPRKGDVYSSQANPTSFKKNFPDIVHTTFEVGLRKTFDWFVNDLKTDE